MTMLRAHRRLLGRCGVSLSRVASASGNPARAVGTSSTPRTQFVPVVRRSFSSTTSGSDDKEDSFNRSRLLVLESALTEVQEHGWTEDAIAAGVIKAKLPPSYCGMVHANDLVSYVMEQANDEFKQQIPSLIPKWHSEEAPLSQRLVDCIKTRLEYVIPYIQSKRWHEAMAVGAMPINNVTVTAKQLNVLVDMIATAVIAETNHAPLGSVERTAIGAVYAATELHLLTDASSDHQDSWDFLRDCVSNLERVAESSPISLINSDIVVAGSAVAWSLGGAVLSLAQPAARGAVSSMASTVVPYIASFYQQTPPSSTSNSSHGTRPSDYDTEKSPPFPTTSENAETKGAGPTTAAS